MFVNQLTVANFTGCASVITGIAPKKEILNKKELTIHRLLFFFPVRISLSELKTKQRARCNKLLSNLNHNKK